ncbi:MAG TPA: flavodoxin domain-containing protein [Acidimicrobiia bacterium]|jgi:menaquinone-dependent protoporphyrinogen oxidase
MTTILVVFHTSEGETARIADHVGAVLQELGDEVEVHDVAGAPAPEHFDGAIVGDSGHAVHHSRALTRYVHDHVAVLNKLPAALFQVSLTAANPDDEDEATAQRLVQELLERTDFDPDLVGLFAGAVVYTRYGWFKRRVVRAISRREGGDTDRSHDHEYTDWQAVEQFARDVHKLVQASAVATS